MPCKKCRAKSKEEIISEINESRCCSTPFPDPGGPLKVPSSTKDRKMLKSFVAYCISNPEQRFWKALRNWSGMAIYVRQELMQKGSDQNQRIIPETIKSNEPMHSISENLSSEESSDSHFDDPPF
jgi:hypothetical protein